MNRKEYFNEAARAWDDEFIKPELNEFLEKFVPTFGIKSGQSVLDAGTGTGVMIPFLVAAVGPSGRVTAVDYSEKMLEICRRKYSHFQNIDFRLQDVEELDFPSESFDCIVCFGLFPHLQNRVRALRHFSRVLRSGGRLVIAHALSSSEIIAHHHKAASTINQDILPSNREMIRLLENTRFTKIHIEDQLGHYMCLSTRQ